MESKTPTKIEKNTKPKWLKKLEKESWQAELVISGAAVFGSLQLPELLDRLEIYLLLNFERFALGLWYLVLMYFRVMIIGLIAVFVFHFLIRALWIGLIGLNSIFPDGFKTNKRFSPDYQQKMNAEYGDIDGFIGRLDNIGSGIFGLGFSIAFMSLNMGLIGSVAVLIASWTHEFEQIGNWVGIILFVVIAIILLLGTLSSILHAPSLQNKEWVKKIHYPITTMMTRLMYPINRQYVVTGLNLFSFHLADKKGYWFYTLGGFILIGFFGGFMSIQNTYFAYYIDRYYHRIANDKTLIEPFYYEDEEVAEIYFNPVLPSINTYSNKQLTAWIPLPKREQEFMYDNCSVAAASKELSRQEKRIYDRQRTIQCAEEYIELKINDIKVEQFTLKSRNLPTLYTDQFGVQVLILNPNLQEGENLLTVITEYPHEEDSTLRAAHIPFYFLN